MMKQLNEIIGSPDILACGLSENALQHRNYKLYLPMEQALSFLISGNIYLSTGRNWNDVSDSLQMQRKGVYGKCFSCSIVDNIAFWMLYSGNGGKSGAMLNFTPTIIKHILKCEKVSLGKFARINLSEDAKPEIRQFFPKYTMTPGVDYTAFATDILYTENLNCADKDKTCKAERQRLTLGENHRMVSTSITNHDDVYIKNYAWSYEKECRVIYKLSEQMQKIASDKGLNIIRITLDRADVNIMRDRLYASPLYCGKADVGIKTQIYGTISYE